MTYHRRMDKGEEGEKIMGYIQINSRLLKSSDKIWQKM